MQCPKCGYLKKAQDSRFVPENECPSCGVIFGKIRHPEQQYKRKSQPMELLNNPSPVSAASLQKARDRVERRLRDQQKTQYHDSRHSQTLNLARRLSAEGVRKRQEEWEKQNRENDAPPTQEERSMKTQPHLQTAPKNELEKQMPQKDLKQSSRTIAMALKKKKSEPVGQPATHCATNESAGAPCKEERPGASVDEPLSSRKPIRIFRNKPIGIEENAQKPPTLKEMLKDFDPLDSNPSTEEKPSRSKNWVRGGLARLLPMVAWMILAAGVIGAILSWTTLANAQPGANTSLPISGNALPFGLLIGFAYLATGVLGFAFFWVSSLISGQLKDIQRLLLLQSATQPEPEDVQ